MVNLCCEGVDRANFLLRYKLGEEIGKHKHPQKNNKGGKDRLEFYFGGGVHFRLSSVGFDFIFGKRDTVAERLDELEVFCKTNHLFGCHGILYTLAVTKGKGRLFE